MEFQATVLECVAIPFSRGIFLTEGSNLGLLHCQQIPYHELPKWTTDGISEDLAEPSLGEWQVAAHPQGRQHTVLV